jgi:hypothetical protein
MKKQTAELNGSALDWAVSKALGRVTEESHWHWRKVYLVCDEYSYSTIWTRGGDFVEQCIESDMLIERVDPQFKNVPKFKATLDRWESVYRGDSVLVAVCRCYVASKLGVEVDIPQEVLEIPDRA